MSTLEIISNKWLIDSFWTGKSAEFEPNGSLVLQFSSGDYISVTPTSDDNYSVVAWVDTREGVAKFYEGIVKADKVLGVACDIENDILGA